MSWCFQVPVKPFCYSDTTTLPLQTRLPKANVLNPIFLQAEEKKGGHLSEQLKMALTIPTACEDLTINSQPSSREQNSGVNLSVIKKTVSSGFSCLLWAFTVTTMAH